MTALTSLPILVIDDDPAMLKAIQWTLQDAGIDEIILCEDSRMAMKLLEESTIGIAMLDLDMPYLSGDQMLERIIAEHPEVPVIIFTGTEDVDTAVRCLKIGAFDYIVKPADMKRIIHSAQRALEFRGIRADYEALRESALSQTLQHPEAFSRVITSDKQMISIFKYIEAIAPSERHVLITGETGVGKELIARAIHTLSGRDGPFIPVNVAGLDDALFTDALFGHVKGAFTGADTDLSGLVAKAEGGSLFLDEIGDVSLSSQAKLLRFLQNGEYSPIGSNAIFRSSARVLALTNRDLQTAQIEGTFRKDLFFRLQTHHVHVPPLRDRRGDISLLLNYFLEEVAEHSGRPKPTPPKELTDIFSAYHFPGNVRELRSMVFDACSGHQAGVLSLQKFKSHISTQNSHAASSSEQSEASVAEFFAGTGKLPTLREVNDMLLKEGMHRAQDNQTVAAELLGLSRAALNKRLTREKKRSA